MDDNDHMKRMPEGIEWEGEYNLFFVFYVGIKTQPDNLKKSSSSSGSFSQFFLSFSL